MYTDIHTHIIPNVDDGPDSVQKSVELAKSALDNGITKLVATPHFYTELHGFEERIYSAKAGLLKISTALKNKNLSFEDILLGFEVSYYDSISCSEDILNLTINGSGYLLLELNSHEITEKAISNMLELEYLGCDVILAHVERFTKVRGFKLLKPLIKNKIVTVQVNASSVLGGPFKRPALSLINEGYADIIASDMHSVDMRPPKIHQAFTEIEKRFGENKKQLLMNNANNLFELFKKTNSFK